MKAWALLLLVALAACGGAPPPAAPPARWSHATVTDVPSLGALLVHGDDLALVERDRATGWHALARADLRDGASVAARPLAVHVHATTPVAGRDALAARGLTLADLADVGHEIVGGGVAPTGFVHLADRRLRVLWWGRLHPAPGGALGSVTLDQAIALPGGERTGLGAADPHDHGPGVRALAVLAPGAQGFDLALLDALSPQPGAWTLHRLDRTGAVVRRPLLLRVQDEPVPTVEALARRREDYVALVGGARLVPFAAPEDGTVVLGTGEALPAPGGWERLAVGSDGTLWLAARRDGVLHLAWR